MSAASLSDLLLFCVNSNCFVCKCVLISSQTPVLLAPLSPVLASIFMEEFESIMLMTASTVEVRLWSFVDEI